MARKKKKTGSVTAGAVPHFTDWRDPNTWLDRLMFPFSLLEAVLEVRQAV